VDIGLDPLDIFSVTPTSDLYTPIVQGEALEAHGLNMTEIELLSPALTPCIALLILSSTTRAGNIRLAIFELARALQTKIDDSPAYQIYMKRLELIGKSLQELYVALLLFIFGSVLSYLPIHLNGYRREVLVLTAVVAFVFVCIAVWELFAESKLVCRSAGLAAQELSHKGLN